MKRKPPVVLKGGRPETKGGKRADLGFYVRSSWEANWARWLKFLEKHKHIKGWEYEPETFEFEAIKKGTRFYTPDFKITETNGRIVYHEIKGYMDKTSATKLKRMAKYYPEKKIIVVDKNQYYAVAKKAKGLIPHWE